MVERVRSREPELSSASDEAGALAHYDDPAYYDKAYASRRDDVAYYVRLGRLSGGPILEYGVGTGRVALPLARAGISVTGVDRSLPMLARLAKALEREPRSVASKIDVVLGDMREVRLGKRFPLVIAAFNTVLHLYTREDVERFFACVRAHLAPGGRFVFDFSVPHAEYLGADPEKHFGSPRFRHPERGLVKYKERFEYDPIEQILLTEMRFSPVDASSPWMVPLTHRQFFPREMEALLHYNGFSDLVWTADFTENAPGWDVDSLVVSAALGRSRAGRTALPRGAGETSKARKTRKTRGKSAAAARRQR